MSDSDLVRLLLEGAGGLALALFGWLLKIAYDNIKNLREDLKEEKNKREFETLKRSELELRIERDFVKHVDLEWIRGTLEKLDQGQRDLVESINRLRVDMAEGRHERRLMA